LTQVHLRNECRLNQKVVDSRALFRGECWTKGNPTLEVMS